MKHAPYVLAQELDRSLGDPRDPGRLFSYARCADLDVHEQFPLEICRELDGLGLPGRYVPVEHGGTLASYEDALQLMRAVARRDLTVAVAHGKTYLGAVSVWVGGGAEQARQLGARISRGAVVSWGLTERDHGSDLLAGEVTADRSADGYLVHGEKWLINNAARGHAVCLLARTDNAGGPRGFSLLLIDKEQLSPQEWRPLPGERLHGIRGADISGIAFTGARVPQDALVGSEGAGLELVLKSLQLTRTLCASLSLGAADHALGLAVGYALDRQMYGRTLIDLPQTRRTLAGCYADLLVAEAVALVAGRAIHTLTGELSVVSAITKYFVPTLVDRAIGRLAVVMGARGLLADGTHEHGRFQKVQRDHRIVGIFDGNTLVNLNSLVNQFAVLARGHRRGLVDTPGLSAATTLDEPVPAFDASRLELLARDGCSVVQSLRSAAHEVRELAAAGEASDQLARQAEEVADLADELHGQLAAYRPSPREVPAAAFALAERYAACFAAAACTHLWLRNRGSAAAGETAALWADGLWLEAALHRLLPLIRSSDPDAGGAVLDRLVPHLTEQYVAGRLLSLLPYRSAESTS